MEEIQLFVRSLFGYSRWWDLVPFLKARRKMKTIRTKDNVYRYGFRYEERIDDRGRKGYVLAPLTEEDILHPRLDDHVTHNQPHLLDCIYLHNVFQAHLAGDPTALVLGDHLIKWDVPGIGDHGPDIAVVFGARQLARRDSFDVAAEGVRPELIIEITSPSTRNNDLNVKPGEYWRVGVPYYVIVDEMFRRRQRQLSIMGFQRGNRSWRRLRLNARGRLWLGMVNLWLGQENGRVVCYDQQGKAIPNQQEVEQARQQAEQARQQAEQAQQQAEQAQQQAEQAQQQAEQAQQQAEQRAAQEGQARQQAEQRAVQEEQARRQAEQARKQAEQRAAEEAHARQLAETEVARLQEELRRLREEK
jgi:colicin import membrane protein